MSYVTLRYVTLKLKMIQNFHLRMKYTIYVRFIFRTLHHVSSHNKLIAPLRDESFANTIRAHDLDRNVDDLNAVIRSLSPYIRPVIVVRVLRHDGA